MDGGGDWPLARRQSSKRSYSTMAESHRSGSPSSLFVPQPQDDHYTNEHAARRPRLRLPDYPARTHFPGDGYDFRRPVMSAGGVAPAVSNPQPVIDLTDDDDRATSRDTETQSSSAAAATAAPARAQRPPRFGRNIIDLASSGEEEQHNTNEYQEEREPRLAYFGQAARRSGGRPHPQFSGLRRPARQPTPPADMDDVELVAMRPRSRPHSRRHTPAMPVQRSVTPYPGGPGGETIDLTGDDDDMAIARAREGVNAARPGMAGAGIGTRSNAPATMPVIGHIANILRGEGANLGGRLMQRIEDLAGYGGDFAFRRQARENPLAGLRDNVNRLRPHPDPRVVPNLPNMPGMMMDYDTIGFDMGLGGNRPPTPKYSPPPEAQAGFTRSPGENEVLVCPNCGNELAMGEGDVKQQVWVVKGCGHAYCGDCASSRSASKKGKQKLNPALPPPLKKCVVEGCGKSLAKTAMIHVYLSS